MGENAQVNNPEDGNPQGISNEISAQRLERMRAAVRGGNRASSRRLMNFD